jgi:metal transporter CNNM
MQDFGMTVYLTWIGIVFCLSQSAIFSGLNLACFSVSRLRLEIALANGDTAAARILALRKDSNFLLTTLLWGNVGINVLLTLLSNSVMTGLVAFIFSTFVITLGGEIAPQAYFSRNALRMASMLAPLIRCYQVLLYVIAKPSAMVLDLWLGKEGIQYYRERDLRQLIHKHIDAADSEVDAVEGIGALNFLAIDDVRVADEGEIIDSESIFTLAMAGGRPKFFPEGVAPLQVQQDFALRVAATRHSWIILVNEENLPVLVLDANAYLRALFSAGTDIVQPLQFCHEPIIVTDPKTRVGSILSWFKAESSAQSDAPLKRDVILLWGQQKRIITGSDILGRLFKGIGLYSSLR